TAGWVTSTGGRQLPSATPAATPAIERALARSRPWPKPATAFSASLVGVGKLPGRTVTPGSILWLNPKVLAALASFGALSSLWVGGERAVLRDWASASLRVMSALPPSSSELWITCPPMLAFFGHCTLDEGVSPAWSRAYAVTTLKVDPGA